MGFPLEIKCIEGMFFAVYISTVVYHFVYSVLHSGTVDCLWYEKYSIIRRTKNTYYRKKHGKKLWILLPNSEMKFVTAFVVKM